VAPVLLGKGLGGPARQVPLSYSGPSESDGMSSGAEVAPDADGSGVPPKAAKRVLHNEAQSPWADGRTFPGTPRNAQCPCGSGRKYKMCHGLNETA
jgi:preprotein translocase subunit SecA